MWWGLGTWAVSPRPSEEKVFGASFCEKLGLWGSARSCWVAAQGASGHSLSLCCVPRTGGAAAAGQAVTRGEPAGPGVPGVFLRG